MTVAKKLKHPGYIYEPLKPNPLHYLPPKKLSLDQGRLNGPVADVIAYLTELQNQYPDLSIALGAECDRNHEEDHWDYGSTSLTAEATYSGPSTGKQQKAWETAQEKYKKELAEYKVKKKKYDEDLAAYTEQQNLIADTRALKNIKKRNPHLLKDQ